MLIRRRGRFGRCLSVNSCFLLSIVIECSIVGQLLDRFHILSDFDEGKRSCRRKLERHNKRRRRKPADSEASAGHELQPVMQNEDSEAAADHEFQHVTQNEEFSYDGEAGKGIIMLSISMPIVS